MNKTFFDFQPNKQFKLNDDGVECRDSLVEAIQPIIDKFMALGYNHIELEYIMDWAMDTATMKNLLNITPQ
jgi:hypothetical protein